MAYFNKEELPGQLQKKKANPKAKAQSGSTMVQRQSMQSGPSAGGAQRPSMAAGGMQRPSMGAMGPTMGPTMSIGGPGGLLGLKRVPSNTSSACYMSKTYSVGVGTLKKKGWIAEDDDGEDYNPSADPMGRTKSGRCGWNDDFDAFGNPIEDGEEPPPPQFDEDGNQLKYDAAGNLCVAVPTEQDRSASRRDRLAASLQRSSTTESMESATTLGSKKSKNAVRKKVTLQFG